MIPKYLTIVLTFLFIVIVGLGLVYYARGYRFDTRNGKLTSSGLLVIKSDPDGAQVIINGILETATNDSLDLEPGTYDVLIVKDGYHNWSKRITIEKEEVTEATAHIFKTVPSLTPITFFGASSPVPSNDLSKIAYSVLLGNHVNGNAEELLGLWVIETLDLPLGFAREPRRITDGDLTSAGWQWSPDSREMLLTTSKGVYLLDTGTFTAQQNLVNVATGSEEILEEWAAERKKKLDSQIDNLPEQMASILRSNTQAVVFSPDKDMVLYTAKGDDMIPDNLIDQLPGSSTQTQERDIKAGRTYVYDIKEDRNFLLDDGDGLVIDPTYSDGQTRRMSWFPSSRHLVLAEPNKIVIIDHDGTNAQEVYAGAYIAPHGFPTVSIDRLLILTDLGATEGIANLYSLSLK